LIAALDDNVQTIFADVKTIIHLKKDEEFDREKVAAVLKKLKVAYKQIERDDSYIL
jgi:hypothetical protein